MLVFLSNHDTLYIHISTAVEEYFVWLFKKGGGGDVGSLLLDPLFPSY